LPGHVGNPLIMTHAGGWFIAGIIADKHTDEVILEPRLIALRYVKTWFFLDLISSLPLDYIILLISPEASASQLLHAGRPITYYS
jgi:hyperpolarization activated cyclic nucleotide-gated potassium channel 2